MRTLAAGLPCCVVTTTSCAALAAGWLAALLLLLCPQYPSVCQSACSTALPKWLNHHHCMQLLELPGAGCSSAGSCC